MTRKILRPKTESLSNMTGQAMWNKFVNVSEDKSAHGSGQTSREEQAATAAAIEERLDSLSIDFSHLSSDITAKQVRYGI